MALKTKPSDKIPELITIGKRLAYLRKELGFGNYEHIAYELQMSRSAYWRLESGENFSIKTLLKVCKHLNITLEEFFQGVQLPKKVKIQKKK
jgi:transcriptional regulator with XRE-family HTH domain